MNRKWNWKTQILVIEYCTKINSLTSENELLDVSKFIANYRNSQYGICTQNITILTGWYPRDNWLCFAKIRQNNGRNAVTKTAV